MRRNVLCPEKKETKLAAKKKTENDKEEKINFIQQENGKEKRVQNYYIKKINSENVNVE